MLHQIEIHKSRVPICKISEKRGLGEVIYVSVWIYSVYFMIKSWDLLRNGFHVDLSISFKKEIF